MYNSDNYKIYGAFVNSYLYPDIKIGKYGTCTLKGDLQELNIGIEYEIKALETQDKYGISYTVQNIKREKPNSLSTSKAFLYEIITPTQADTLLAVYPDIIDRIIKNRLDDIDLNKTYNIKEYTFNVIKRKVIENFKLADLVEEFQGVFNISILKKLYDKYTSIEKIREVIREKPYECLCKLSGIGFKTADSMLLNIDEISKENIKNGKKPILYFNCDLKTSYQRMKACVDFILDENENNGNTYMDIHDFKKQCDILAKECIQHLASILKGDNDIYFDKENLRVAKKETFETEQYIANKLLNGLKNNIEWKIDTEKYRKLSDFVLSDEQIKTLNYICKYNIVLLNGFGGSGKSSSIKALVNMLSENHKSFIQLAPTGRAAKVLSGYTGYPASTIHRGLAYQPPTDWGYNENHPLTEQVVIVDESSMIDIFLMKHLIEAIDFTKTKLLLIGDDAQIPSVGAGNILYDLLHSGIIPSVTLNKIFRYGEGGLMTVATDTRNSEEYLGKENNGIQIFGNDKSYMFIPVSQTKLISYIVALYKKVLSQGYNTEDVIILSCYNKGDYGTVVINNAIQKAVNQSTELVKYGEIKYKLNDLVIQCVNDYKAVRYNSNGFDEDNTTFIPNGEIGKIIKVEKNAIVVDFDGNQIYITKNTMNNIKLAYAISTHKSQGGQFKVVILVTPKAHTYMLNSNLLYVGETRAKEKCYHMGEIKTINCALKKKENFNRKTFLCDLLKDKS